MAGVLIRKKDEDRGPLRGKALKTQGEDGHLPARERERP